MSSYRDNIHVFEDTFSMARGPALREQTDRMVLGTRVYQEGFRAPSRPAAYSAELRLLPLPTLKAARLLARRRASETERIAVLNFANPREPGGGVRRGARAQEESLCRSSNLYCGLLAENAERDYYAFHREQDDYRFSDRIVFCPGVCVYKTDDDPPAPLDRQDWYEIDVLTCAAPYIPCLRRVGEEELFALCKQRVTNIFEVALAENTAHLILGAFGCGVFCNPPEQMSRAFLEAIKENGYEKNFRSIVFAIPSSPTAPSPNMLAFEQTFQQRAEQPTD
ncbi:MAG: TIGR02452 family protein [Oscillospiraceae bacterium]|nr:TIGR02452 family protein [Oscillospiraceae bacterium]